MKTLNSYFDKIYCINLDRAVDRLNFSLRQAEKYNYTFERFQAIEPEKGNNTLLKGELGCLRSHYEIIKKAKEKNIEKILILEDDASFVDDFNVKFTNILNEIPDNWDFLYFGGSHLGGLSKITEHIYKIFNTYTTHAVAIKNTMYDTILNTLPKEEIQVDVYYASMMPRCNAYVIRPHLAYQREGYSYIQNENKNYDFLK